MKRSLWELTPQHCSEFLWALTKTYTTVRAIQNFSLLWGHLQTAASSQQVLPSWASTVCILRHHSKVHFYLFSLSLMAKELLSLFWVYRLHIPSTSVLCPAEFTIPLLPCGSILLNHYLLLCPPLTFRIIFCDHLLHHVTFQIELSSTKWPTRKTKRVLITKGLITPRGQLSTCPSRQ